MATPPSREPGPGTAPGRRPRPLLPAGRPCRRAGGAEPPAPPQPGQSTATARAAPICRMRTSANRPGRSTSTATESGLTAERLGTGSSCGSSTTSLARPRIVVVQGATSARRSRGTAASRDRTTTGRRPISASSHHHTSPRAGSALTRRPQPVGRTRGRPIRPARRAGARRRPHNPRRSPPHDGAGAAPRVPRRSGRHRWCPPAVLWRGPGAVRRRSCSDVCDPCHHHATQRRRSSLTREEPS